MIDRKNDGAIVRKVISDWVDKYKKYEKEIWKPSLTSLRIISWIMNAELILSSKNITFGNEFVKVLFTQINHLKESHLNENEPSKQIEILSAIILSGIVFKDREDNFNLGFSKLEKLLVEFFDVNGFPHNKNPYHILKFLKFLILIKECLKESNNNTPEYVDKIIEKFLKNISYLITPSKQLPLFNGTSEINLDSFLEYLKNLNYRTKEEKELSIDIKKIRFKKDVIFLDTSSTPKKKFSGFYQSGPLSFEYFFDKNKIITNGGFGSSISKKAALISRLSSSQSSITINDYSATRLERNNLINRTFGYLIKDPIKIFDVSLEEDNVKLDLSASHDAYKKRLGLKVSRLIRINKISNDIQGEDTLTKSNALPSDLNFTIRFHLYPGVGATKTMSGRSALIQLNKNKSLLFHSDNCSLDIEKGIFFGKNKIINNLNIFLKGKITKEKEVICWGIKKNIDA